MLLFDQAKSKERKEIYEVDALVRNWIFIRHSQRKAEDCSTRSSAMMFFYAHRHPRLDPGSPWLVGVVNDNGKFVNSIKNYVLIAD